MLILLVLSVTPFKIDEKNQNHSIDKVRPESGKWKEVNIPSFSPRFRSAEEYFAYEISKEMFYPNLKRFVWRRHAGAHLDGHPQGGRKPTKTSITEFWYRSLNLFLEEFINIKLILSLIHELFRSQNSPKDVTFWNDNSPGRHVNATSHKSLEIQTYSITKPRTLLKRKFVWKLVFSCSNTLWK